MNCDSYFEIGSSHLSIPCQDYALHGVSPDKGMHYAIISDGCSSSVNSEIGAQILCHVAKSFLLLFHESNSIMEGSTLGSCIIKKADEIRKLYGINNNALDATLLVAFTRNGRCVVYGWGDGVIIIKIKTEMLITHLEYESGAPFYLSYSLDDERKKSYFEQFGKGNVLKQTQMLAINGETRVSRVPIDSIFISLTDIEDIGSVTICSDGICSYSDADKKQMNYLNMAEKFTASKRTNGEFVKSNMLFLRKTNEKQGITHYDDISCATIIKENA